MFISGPNLPAEARDIALSKERAVDLFDQTELAIALGYAHRSAKDRATIWIPIGMFIWKSGGLRLEEELKRIEQLPGGGRLLQVRNAGRKQIRGGTYTAKNTRLPP